MNFVLTALVMSIPAVAAVSSAAYMAINGISGGGWFLFIAVLLSGFSIKSDDKD